MTTSPAHPAAGDMTDAIISPGDRILITGAAGFIGSRVVARLLDLGFTNLKCLVRSPSAAETLRATLAERHKESSVQALQGNLLSRDDCCNAVRGVTLIYHLAAGRGQKSYADAFLNSVVTTRNLLDALLENGGARRFVNVSSFSVYATPPGRLLDERCPLEPRPHLRGDAYTYAKVRQDELVLDYAARHRLSCVLVRPGVVYGPGNEGIHGRVGLATFGLFLHLGGSNRLPLTYVDNCADAIVLAGLKPGVEGEAFNIVDDDLPTSRRFLRLYKRHVRRFPSVYVPHAISYLLCWCWEAYARRSQEQLPPVFNRLMWKTYWRRTRYTNEKAKRLLGWSPAVPTYEALLRHFESCRRKLRHA